MLSSSISLYLVGAISGVYIFTTLFIGLEFTCDAFRLRRSPLSPAMRIFGVGMFLDMLSILSAMPISMLYPDSILPIDIASCLDGYVSVFICLTGYALVRDRYPSWRTVLSLVIPVLTIQVASVVFSGCYMLFCLLTNLFFLCHYIYIGTLMYKYDHRLLYKYSDIKNRRVSWFIFYIVLVIIEMPAYFIFISSTLDDKLDDAIFYVIVIMFYLYIARQLYFHQINNEVQSQETAKKGTSNETEQEKEDNTPRYQLDGRKAEEVKFRLTQLMEVEHIYTDANLTMYDLIRRLETNSTYFYYFMRDVMGMKFYDYVNGYRLEQAKILLSNTTDKIENIALVSGFNSYNTFVHAFKKYTGSSPNQWRKEHANLKVE